MSKSIRFWVLSALLVLLHTTSYAEKYDGLYDRPTYFQDFQQSTTWVNNMVCVVCVRTGENGPKVSNYEVAVYDKDGVLRCCKRSIAADGDLATLTIVGNDGETFTFKVVYGDIASPTVAAVEETLTFVTNGVVGKTEPMSLTLAGRTWLTEENKSLKDKAGADVTVAKPMKGGEWNTLILPFSMTAEQIVAALGTDVVIGSLTGYKATDDVVRNEMEINMLFDTVDVIEAHEPYLVKVKRDVETFEVDGVDIEARETLKTLVGPQTTRMWAREVGTYTVGKTVPGGCFVLRDGVATYSEGGEGGIAAVPFSFYFDFSDVPAAGMGMRLVFNKETESVVTGSPVEPVEGGAAEGETIYDLTGQKVSHPLRRGVYVRGGKILVIK